MIPTPEELGFDVDFLREKYESERIKRVRPAGKKQFDKLEKKLKPYDIDPHVTPGFTRDPICEDLDTLIVGGGFSALLAAKHLKDSGIENFRMVEKAGDFGGVWYWNRYPGAQCDVESYIYLPLLEETGYIPSEKYVHQPEILEHAQRIGRHYNLYDKACFQTTINKFEWDDCSGRWLVGTRRGDVFRARFVVMTSGLFTEPQLPSIEGIEHFKGDIFHTSRWDYDCTGGDTTGGMGNLNNKKVAVVGTGATGVQCVPYVAKDAKHLYVIQRTPSSVDARRNAPTDPEWVKTLKPGWYADRNENFAKILSGVPVEKNLVNDGWTDLFKFFADGAEILATVDDPDVAEQLNEINDFKGMERLRDRAQFFVRDKSVAEQLKPWYGTWCKRPTFNDQYYPAFNRENVTLVDTQGKGIEKVTEKGLVVDGVEYEVDCIIFATGFETATGIEKNSEVEIKGRNGLKLSEYWSDGVKTLHGQLSHGFPNCFHTGLRQAAFLANFMYLIDREMVNITYIIKEVMDRGAISVEPSVSAQQAWMDVCHEPTFFSGYLKTCTPGYYNNNGRTDERSFLQEVYPPGCLAFFDLLRRWREGGRLDGLLVNEASSALTPASEPS